MITITLSNQSINKLNKDVQELTETDLRLTKAELQRLINDVIVSEQPISDILLNWATEAEAA